MKFKLLPIAIIGGAVALLRNNQARQRAAEWGGKAVENVQGLISRRRSDQADLPVNQYRVTTTGDVETEDQGGSWADDGGGGRGGGQATSAAGSAPASSAPASSAGGSAPASSPSTPAGSAGPKPAPAD